MGNTKEEADRIFSQGQNTFPGLRCYNLGQAWTSEVAWTAVDQSIYIVQPLLSAMPSSKRGQTNAGRWGRGLAVPGTMPQGICAPVRLPLVVGTSGQDGACKTVR